MISIGILLFLSLTVPLTLSAQNQKLNIVVLSADGFSDISRYGIHAQYL